MLATFQAHQFKLSELESIVPTREPTERYSQDQTGNSENGLMMDSSDKEKIKEDLAAYKVTPSFSLHCDDADDGACE